ncbi:MAG: hypothetical protein ACOX1I_03680 [Dethiobacteria bacterium]|jgi:hypothetical protein
MISKDFTNKMNKSIKSFLPDDTTLYFQIIGNKVISFGSPSSKAINNYKNEKKEVNVVKWIKDFWLYVEFNLFNTDFIYFSLSVFKGKSTDKKTQLFRAEWDNYQDNNKHPQPHWHVYPYNLKDSSFKDFAEIILEENQNDFMEFLNMESSDYIDIKKIHFAMNGMWGKNESHIHSFVTDDTFIINWFFGLIGHIKEQLEYIS